MEYFCCLRFACVGTVRKMDIFLTSERVMWAVGGPAKGQPVYYRDLLFLKGSVLLLMSGWGPTWLLSVSCGGGGGDSWVACLSHKFQYIVVVFA